MKTLFILSVAVLGLVPVVSGTTTAQNGAPATAIERSASMEPEMLAQLKVQATSSDATLSRPL
jgi:hypothetical protein